MAIEPSHRINIPQIEARTQSLNYRFEAKKVMIFSNGVCYFASFQEGLGEVDVILAFRDLLVYSTGHRRPIQTSDKSALSSEISTFSHQQYL